jgi:hypothetical protein
LIFFEREVRGSDCQLRRILRSLRAEEQNCYGSSTSPLE